MIDFYPMPTNLNQTSGLYYHHQNHGGARFLDVPITMSFSNNFSTLPQPVSQTTALINCIENQGINSENSNNNVPSSTNLVNRDIRKNINDNVTETTCNTQATGFSKRAQNSNKNLTSLLTTTSSNNTAAQIPNTPATCKRVSDAEMDQCVLLVESSPLKAKDFLTKSLSRSLRVEPLESQISSRPYYSSFSSDCQGRTEVGQIKCEKNFEICEGCGHKIHDRFMMNVGETNWHEKCLACAYCGLQLHHICYVRNSKTYCKSDYDRLFSIKCIACFLPILSQELVMRPNPNLTFHLACFTCYSCRLPLQKGEQFLLKDGHLLCFRHDLEKEIYFSSGQHCGFVGLDDEDLLRPRDGRRGPKRPRTILTSQQRKQFKASFDQSPKPCRKVREALAKDTGLSVRVVQVWFQNQRAKMKKIQRKSKNCSNSSRSIGNGGEKDLDKDDGNIKQESGSGSENGFILLENSFTSQPLNPNVLYSPHDYPTNSNDSFCSSDLSLDGSNIDNLDDDTDSRSLNNLELQSTESSIQNQSTSSDLLININTSVINPIDKLYLMQNSYFNSDR